MRGGGAAKTRPHRGRADHVRFFFAVLTEAIQIFFSSVHLPGVSVSLQYPLSMRIHDYRFPESASFERKKSEKVKSTRLFRNLSILVGEDGFPLTGINFDSIFHAKKNTNHPKRVIGIFGGGRWISPDGDKLRLHLPCKEKYRPPKRVIGIFGGGRWIRTIEGIASRFTVCPLWPLGNSPICNFVRRWSW